MEVPFQGERSRFHFFPPILNMGYRMIQLDQSDEEQSLSKSFEDITLIYNCIKEISNLQQEAKTIDHNERLLNSISAKINSDMATIVATTKNIKARLESHRNTSTMNELRIKLSKMMIDFQSLREKIVVDEEPNSEILETTRLRELQHVFLDMVVLMDRQGEDQIDDTVKDVARGEINFSGGTNGWIYGEQMTNIGWKWGYWIGGLVVVLVLAWIIVSI
ncbi:syntaxin of plants 112 [Hibiscus trionum]|uniref:Syntaxin of plants 112 n=1 Tax=Hibiscus trionum TaxID=183268 RepID=A0A9W7MPE6_HIBTR|nr:syntaxin of plants 112 [Hibiscus trionum]